MKRITVCIITMLIMALLCAFCISSVWQGEADAAGTTAPSPIAISDVRVQAEDLVGLWSLAAGNNDLSMVTEQFPGYAEWDATMEICSDGTIYWYIGAIGGMGTFSLDGDTLTAYLNEAIIDAASEPQSCTVVFKAVSGNGETMLAMKHGNATVLWSHGEASDTSNENLNEEE